MQEELCVLIAAMSAAYAVPAVIGQLLKQGHFPLKTSFAERAYMSVCAVV